MDRIYFQEIKNLFITMHIIIFIDDLRKFMIKGVCFMIDKVRNVKKGRLNMIL